MLTAVGIGSQVEPDGDAWVLRVDAALRAHALHHLWQYEQERQRPLPPEAPFVPQPAAWRGSVVYAVLLLLVPLLIAQGWVPGRPYEVGVLDPARMHVGQWWRAVTALTLHWDAAHLLGNLGSGMLLGFSAAQIWGSARAWLLILVAAVLANVAEGLIGFDNYVSAGASTGVFAALGLVAAHAWRTRRQRAGSSLRRWAPLIAGIAMLGFFGMGSQEPGAPASDPTNVLSHVLGFTAGALLGALVARRQVAQLLQDLPAWVAATVACGAVVLAWTLALNSNLS